MVAIRSCLFCNGTHQECLHAPARITPRRQDTPAILTLNLAHFSPPSADEDVKRQALEMQATLHGVPGHPLLWGDVGCRQPNSSECLVSQRGWQTEKEICWCGPHGNPRDMNLTQQHGPRAGSPVCFKGMLCALCSIRSRSEVQKHRNTLGFSSCLRRHELTVPLK